MVKTTTGALASTPHGGTNNNNNTDGDYTINSNTATAADSTAAGYDAIAEVELDPPAEPAADAKPQKSAPLFRVEWVPLDELVHAARGSVGRTTPMAALKIAMSVVALLVTFCVMSLTMNFYLSRITVGTAGYVSNVAPAVVWAVLSVAICLGYHAWRGWVPFYLFGRKGVPASPETRALRRRLWGTLIALGIVDALGGLTVTYSAPHTPVFLQTLLISLGVVWCFMLTRWLVPHTPSDPLPQLTPISLSAYLLTIAGTIVATLPHRDTLDEAHNAIWVGIFAISTALPVVYNVLQGRFLRLVDQLIVLDAADVAAAEASTFLLDPPPARNEKEHDRFSVKMVMLTVDTVVMLLFIVAAFPVDFAPWYGDSPGDPGASWSNFVAGLRCTFDASPCSGTAGFFFAYSLAFWANHFVFAQLNYLSPTVTAFCAAVALPIQLLLLYLFPRLNVWGSRTPLGYTLVCFATTLVAAVLFFAAEQARALREAQRLAADALGDPEEVSEHGRVQTLPVSLYARDGDEAATECAQ